MSQRWCGSAGTLRAVAIACLALAPQAGAAGETAPTQAGSDAASFADGMAAAQRGDLFRAATIFNGLLRQHPHDPGAYVGLAEVQVRSGHLDEADAWLLRGIAANPGNGNLLHARAHVALLQHHERAAADLLVHAIALDPGDADSRSELAELYAGPLGQPGQALALRQPAPQAEQTESATATQRNIASAPDRSRPAERPAAAAQPFRPSADLYYRLGLAASARGDLAQAQQLLQKAVALRPWMGEAQTALWSLADRAPNDASALRRPARKPSRTRDKNS